MGSADSSALEYFPYAARRRVSTCSPGSSGAQRGLLKQPHRLERLLVSLARHKPRVRELLTGQGLDINSIVVGIGLDGASGVRGSGTTFPEQRGSLASSEGWAAADQGVVLGDGLTCLLVVLVQARVTWRRASGSGAAGWIVQCELHS